MSIFSKKNNSILITPNSKHVIWNVPTDGIDVNTQVTVDTGCIAVYVVNGHIRNTFNEGNFLINDRRERRDITTLALIAANEKKVVKICFGVGGVPFADRELEVDTVVGTSADMQVSIRDPWKLYTMMGNHDVTEEAINDFLRGKLSEVLKTELAKQLQFNTYGSLAQQTKKMSEKLSAQVKEIVFDFGLKLEDNTFALGDFYFQDDYLALRKRAGEVRAESQIAEEQIKTVRKRSRAELEIITAISAATNASNPESDANKKCPNCGIEVKNGTNFCPVCGAKIK